MTDIVERLRDKHADLRGDDYWAAIFQERKEAADEIERLRAALKRIAYEHETATKMALDARRALERPTN